MTTLPLTRLSDTAYARIKENLRSASKNDRAYEKPMSWEDADNLIAEVDRLRRALSTPPVGGLDREAVARIIEPDVWTIPGPAYSGQAQRNALKTADAIIALATPQWLPIPLTVDTSKAPFDGEDVLVTGGGLETSVAIAHYSKNEGCWDCIECTLATEDDERPTHYMPLPRGPQ